MADVHAIKLRFESLKTPEGMVEGAPGCCEFFAQGTNWVFSNCPTYEKCIELSKFIYGPPDPKYTWGVDCK
jgi:hypothetical protein